MRIIAILSLLFMALSGLSGCATRSSEQVFQSTLRTYERIMRWGDLTQSNQFRKQPVIFSSIQRQRLALIKITGYTINQVKPRDDETIMVDVTIHYYNKNFVREKVVRDYQQWDYDSDQNLWFISSPFPEF